MIKKLVTNDHEFLTNFHELIRGNSCLIRGNSCFMPSYVLYRIVRFTCFVIFKICFAFRVEGKENIPKGENFILASNHTSYLDPVALAISIPQVVHFMARDDLFDIKLFGALIRKLAAFPIRKGHRDCSAMKNSLKMLETGRVIAIFPEGKRIEGPELGEPELGIGMLAAHSRIGVLPVFIKGTNKALPIRAKFIRLRPVKVRIGKLLKFNGHKERLERKQAYRAFTNKIMESISNLKMS